MNNDEEQESKLNNNNISKWNFDRNKIPTEIGLLPSLGRVYPKGHPFHNLTYVPIKGMLVADEEILLNVAYAKMGITTIELLKSCISLPGIEKINASNVLAGDVASLLYSIRINSYGPVYDPTIKCPSCDRDVPLNINLARFPVNTLDLEPSVPFSNAFRFRMPGKTKANRIDIDFGFLMFDDAEKLSKMLQASEDFIQEFSPTGENGEETNMISVKGNAYVTTLLETSIKAINGNADRMKIKQYVRNLRIGDSMAFRNFVKANEPTIYANFDFKCSECEFESNIPMPMNHELFGIRPEHKVEVLLEPHFILTYYSGFSYEEYQRYPVAYKKHYIERMNEEIQKAQKAQSDVPHKAPHANSSEIRSLTGKVNPTTTSSKLQRFT